MPCWECEDFRELDCPYCHHTQEIGEQERIWNESEIEYFYTCQKCKLKFAYQIETTRTYHASTITCLNGGPHDRRLRRIDNKRAFVCDDCGDAIIRDCLKCDVVLPISDEKKLCENCNSVMIDEWCETSSDGGKWRHGHMKIPRCLCGMRIELCSGGGGGGVGVDKNGASSGANLEFKKFHIAEFNPSQPKIKYEQVFGNLIENASDDE